jgi:hypothetical protein
MPDTKRVYWRDAVPVRSDASTVSVERLAGHFAAMAHAHLTEYGEKLVRGPQTREALRGIVSEHFDPACAAFAAAAALRGCEPAQIVDAIEDGQSMHEFVWEWVADAVDDADVDALLATLSTSALDGEPKAAVAVTDAEHGTFTEEATVEKS